MVKPIISIIIVDFKAEKYLPNCLASIKKHLNARHEIIVVDNNKVNRGFAKAANIGAKKACGEYLFFLNPDAIIERGDFEKLIDYLNSHSRIGVMGLKMVLGNGSPQPFSFGAKYSLFGAVKQKLGMAIKLTESNPDWVSGGAMIVKTAVFHKLGGFNEQFFMYFEDQDLCLRAKDLDYRVVLWENITVTHLGGVPQSGGSHGNIAKQVEMYKKSQALFMKKHYNLVYFSIFKLLRSLWL
ncbi:MAG: glycosyltransferase family 2 protein [bacterium]